MASSINELVAKLGADSPGEAFAAFKQMMEMARRATAPGKESERAEIAAALAEELNAQTPATKNEKGKEIPPQPKYSARVRGKICEVIEVVGGAKEVPALVKAMEGFDVREPARCALAVNPSDEATEALVKALEAVGADYRVGVVNALGRRPGEKVVGVLRAAAASDEDPAVRMAAVQALANIPEPANAEVVLKTAQCTKAGCTAWVWKSAVRLAENLRKAGLKAEATELYRKIEAQGPDAQKAAAGIGLEAKG